MASQDNQQTGQKNNGAGQGEAASIATANSALNPLSDREMEVSALLATGASNAEIARELVISPHTVKVHLRNVFEKLDVSSRTEATLVLLQRGWLSIPGVDALANESVVAGPPEPEPLEDLAAAPAPWQRLFLIATVAFLLILLASPVVLTRPKTSFSLLSDAGQTVFGQTIPLALPRWSAHTPLPQARSRHASVLAGNSIYVLGGENAEGQTLDSVTAYDLQYNQWRPGVPMPEPLANLAATALDGRIYVAGGSANGRNGEAEISVRDQLYTLDLETDEWQRSARLPHPLAGAALVAHDGFLYLVGGWDGEQMRDEIWRWRPGVLKEGQPDWEEFSHLKTPAAFFGSVVVGDDVYVIGGYDGQRELADASVLNLSTGEWRQLPSMSMPRSGLSAVYDGMAVFALGGGWTKTIETHERYDALANQWSNFPSPVQGDWRHLGAVAYNGRVSMIGGWSGGYLDAYQEHQSAFRSLLPVIQSD
jgi:DNA-binding CsgD family transcriptional regulator